jgi:hypothetical protein
VAEDEHLAAVDGAPARDHAVARYTTLLHAEVAGAMHGEEVELDERARIEQPIDALPRRELALGMLGALGRARTMHGVVATFAQQVDLAFGRAARSARGRAVAVAPRRNARRSSGRRHRIAIARANRRYAFTRCSGHAQTLQEGALDGD